MKKVIRGIGFVFVVMSVLAIMGKFLPFNMTTPFFKWYTPYSIQILLEIVLLLSSCLFLFGMQKKKRSVIKKEKKIFNIFFSADLRVQKRKLLIIYFILNLAVATLFSAKPGWDYGTVLRDSATLLQHGEIGLREYVMQYPNNLLYILSVMPVVFIFGISDAAKVLTYMNILLILLTMSFFMDIVYKMTKSLKRMRFSALVFMLFLPLVYYNQTFYTDTIVLPFILGGIILLFDEQGELTQSKKKFVQATGLFIIGALFKASILVILVAMSIVCFICYKKWKKLYGATFVVGLLSVKIMTLILIGGWSFIYPPLYNKHVTDVGVPESAWMCMAQNDDTRGDYNDQDAKRTMSLYRDPHRSKADVETEMKACMRERITTRTLVDNVAFLFRKFAFSWSDPSYYAVYNLGLISSPLGEKLTYGNLKEIVHLQIITII